MGSTHLQAWSKVPGFELAAVASRDEVKLTGDLSSIQGNLGIEGSQLDFGNAERYRDAADLIADPRVEAVDLCTPTHLHAEQTVMALEAGKHVLVEKPMALSAEECDRMLAAAEANGRVLMVAQVLRFWPDYAAARKLALSGEIGTVLSAFFRRKCGAPGWNKWLDDKSRSGGGVFDLLIHDFDFCRHLLGKPSAVEATGVERLAEGIDVIEARLDYGDGGPQALISGGWHHPKSYPFSMEFTIVCEGGTLDLRPGGDGLKLHAADGEERLVEKDDVDGFEAEAAAFAAACEAGAAPNVCPPEESADAVRIALAADRSRARGGAAVEV